jgi:hypothetical protein
MNKNTRTILRVFSVCLGMLYASTSLYSQPFRAEIYHAYITGNMDMWEKSLEGYSVKPTSPDALYDLSMA